MKVLFVISSMGMGGEQRAASNITGYLYENNYDITVLTFNGSEGKRIEFNKGIQIIVCDHAKNNISKLYAIRNELQSNKYDVVIGFAVIPSILCAFSALGLKVPVIVCERNDPDVYPKLWKVVRSVAYHLAEAAVFQTHEASDYFQKDYFKKRTIIPNPIREDISSYQKDYYERKPVIVNTSRLTKIKNQKLIIEAFSEIADAFPQYELRFYGDGDNKIELVNLIHKKGLDKRVIISESVSNIFEVISEFQIFVLTSNHEGFPNSLAEAMAMGLAVISVDCRIGGPKDMIENGRNGILIAVDDKDNLVKSLKSLIENTEKRVEISRNAIDICTKLDINVIGEKWEAFIRDVVRYYEDK